MPIKRVARAVDAAFRDAGRARERASDPAFQRRVRTARRGSLSEFATVQHALADRERGSRSPAARAKRAQPKGSKAPGDAPGASAAGKSARTRKTASATTKAGKKSGTRARRLRTGIGAAARTLDAAFKDGAVARREAHDPVFRRELQVDRRAALGSRFTTVKQALADREKAARAKGSPKRQKR